MVTLKTGDKVMLRNGKLYMILKDTAMSSLLVSENGDVISLDSYGEDLRTKRNRLNQPSGLPFDIVKILRPTKPNDILNFNAKTNIVIWFENSEIDKEAA